MLLLPSHRRRRRRHHGVVGGFISGVTLRRGAGCLVLLAFFAVLSVHRTSSSTEHPRHEGGDRPGGAAPTITVFSALLPPLDGSPTRQELAVRSWLALPGNVSVVLLGSHPSTLALAGRLGRRVTVDAAVDSSFTGTPFFHSMVARAQAAAGSDICVLVDADIVLLPESVTLLTDLSRVHRDWLLVSMSSNNSDLDSTLQEDGSDRRFVLAWNNPSRPLLVGVLPPFLYGRGAHTSWLAHEVLSSEMRLVFDASNIVLGLDPKIQRDASSSRNARFHGGSWPWEHNVNRHLAAVYGSYCYQLPGRHPAMLYKVVKHYEGYLLSKVEEPSLANFIMGTQQNVHTEGNMLWERENICMSDHLQNYSSDTSEAGDVPYSLPMLLQFVADENRSVVLGVAGASYRDMLMSWVCRLRRLRVANFVVCALDHDTYRFSVSQGLPVFRDPLSPKNVSFDDCHFGTQCFQQVTKVKSRIVLEILRLGYNVLLSDVDVYWFHNPLRFLYSLGPGTFAAQSDEYNETGPINLPRKLNSGFYYARSDAATITAMEMVVEHARRSSSSEQPSFYDVLCGGEEGANRRGGDGCLEPGTGLAVVFLDRDRFPNGAYRGLWEKHDVRSACVELGCLVIHNNWVKGRKKKLRRQMASGLWDYDPSSRMCLHSRSDAPSE